MIIQEAPASLRQAAMPATGVSVLILTLNEETTQRFPYMYILRLGILDGWAGYTYCSPIAFYDQMIVVKIAELQRRERSLPL